MHRRCVYICRTFRNAWKRVKFLELALVPLAGIYIFTNWSRETTMQQQEALWDSIIKTVIIGTLLFVVYFVLSFLNLNLAPRPISNPDREKFFSFLARHRLDFMETPQVRRYP